MSISTTLPARIENVEHLEDLLATPTQPLIDDLARLEGDIMILGAAGKIGPGLARLAKRAAPDKKVIAVARFSDASVKTRLQSWGVETITCDLCDRDAVRQLPQAENIIYMAGRKFGTTGDEPFSWIMNVVVPGIVAETFTTSNIVAFSTLCVYPFAQVVEQGFDESVPPGPPGEYANSCIGRERVFQYFTGLNGNRGLLFRLNYAIDMRYGVLHDIARRVFSETPIDLRMGHVNVIWQGDVNSQALRSLLHCTSPASPLNIGGPEICSVRALARRFGRRFGKTPVFENTEATTSLINSTAQAARLFGYPQVTLDTMIEWIADWLERGMEQYDKPTRYEVRDGKF